LALSLSANAIETVTARCEHATSVEAAIEACSSIINTDKDRHRLAIAHFNRAGWHLKKDEVDLAASDLSEAIRFEPDFAAALTERGLVEERLNDLRRARADFTAVLKLPQTDSTSVWAHAKARERLAATEATAHAVANPNPTAATPSAGAPASDFWRRPLAQVLQECNAKPAVTVKLPGAKGTIELNRCYRGRDHRSCIVTALVAEANSIKQDYAEIVSADYPELKALDSLCQLSADRLSEHYKAIQTFQNRWALLRKEYAAQLDCNNSVEDALRNLSLADMSHGADVVKSIVDSLRNELTEVSLVQKPRRTDECGSEGHREHKGNSKRHLSVMSERKPFYSKDTNRGKTDATYTWNHRIIFADPCVAHRSGCSIARNGNRNARGYIGCSVSGAPNRQRQKLRPEYRCEEYRR
jgi:tetratricopeptide (TPR) repeat protein